jgi:hypothetical protein
VRRAEGESMIAVMENVIMNEERAERTKAVLLENGVITEEEARTHVFVGYDRVCQFFDMGFHVSGAVNRNCYRSEVGRHISECKVPGLRDMRIVYFEKEGYDEMNCILIFDGEFVRVQIENESHFKEYTQSLKKEFKFYRKFWTPNLSDEEIWCCIQK